MRGQAYHGDGPLPLKELRALRILASRLRGQAELAIKMAVFDVNVSREIDRLLGLEHDLAEMIRDREREHKGWAA
jgi:hypothetical protein